MDGRMAADILTERGVDPKTFDDLVHDLVSRQGSNINNGGLYEQLEFLFRELGPKEAQAEITKIVGAGWAARRPTPRPGQRSWRVVWEIDVDADTAAEAAAEARRIQQDPSSTADLFTASCDGASYEIHTGSDDE